MHKLLDGWPGDQPYNVDGPSASPPFLPRMVAPPNQIVKSANANGRLPVFGREATSTTSVAESMLPRVVLLPDRFLLPVLTCQPTEVKSND